MARYILSYRASKNYNPMTDSLGIQAWEAFIRNVIGPNTVDPGWPVFEASSALGVTDETTQLGGFCVIEVDDLETALHLARQCPSIKQGGGVEVGILATLPADHPAEQLRSKLVGGEAR